MEGESCTSLPSTLPHPWSTILCFCSRWGRLQRAHGLGVLFVQLGVFISGYFPVDYSYTRYSSIRVGMIEGGKINKRKSKITWFMCGQRLCSL